MPDGTLRRSSHRRPSTARRRRGIEPLEARVLFATTVFSDGFEGSFLTGWTNRTASGANSATRWGVNTVRAAAGAQSAFASALQGGVSAAQGYQNNQDNTLVRPDLSLAGYGFATLSFDYFLNSESGYDTFTVAIREGATGARTTLFSESGNFAGAGWRSKTIDVSAFAGKSDLDVEFRFQSDSSVTQEGGGVWIDQVKLVGDAAPPPGTISGKLFDDSNNNKVRDSGEAALANWRVYLDQNRNGVRDASEASKLTDSSGNYSFTNLSPGTYYVAEEIPSGWAQTSPGASGASTGSSFKIDVVFPDNTMTAAQRAAFSDAANRWAQIIVGDIADVNDGGTLIDDVRITATAPSIDGRGGILGQAAPTAFRSGSNLPFKGFMEFDAADLAQLEADGQLSRVILHEMAHVLGLGTIWGAKGLLSGGGSADPRYTGPAAAAQYNSIFSTSGSTTPVEGGGSGGTNDSHWRESVLGNELMTGYLNGGSNPLSRITVGAMADLGYAVSYSAADAYAKPALISSSLVAAGPTSYEVSGPFAKALRDVSFYGAMQERPVAITASNTATASDTTLLGFAHTVFVDTGTTRGNIDFGNRRSGTTPTGTGGSIAGTVFNDTNGNGVKDTGEVGVSGVRVYIDADKDGTFDSTEKNVVTGTSGAYSFTGLSAATYNVRQVDPSGWTRTTSSPVVTLAANASATGKNFGNFKHASIAGRVFDDKDRDGVQDSGEAGLSGVRVYDDKNGNGRYDSGERNTTTNSSGDYTLGSLPAGTRTVRIVMPTGRTLTSPSAGYHRVTPTSGQAINGKRFGTRVGTTTSSLQLATTASLLADELV